MVDVSEFEKRLSLRHLKAEDYPQLRELGLLCFPKMEPWTQEQFVSQLKIFPEGQFGIEKDGRLIASCSSVIVDYDLYSDWHDWNAISDDGCIRNHNPEGDALYGIEIQVHPEFRGMRLARRLYDARKQLVRERNLKGIIIGGRIPNYSRHADEMTAYEYAEAVQAKSIFDPVLTAQLANGFEVKQLHKDYLPSDEDSAGWATHMEWLNVDYRPFKKRAMAPTQLVRIAATQYQMRAIDSFEQFQDQTRFFIDSASDYKSDFLIFPELFTTQLMSFCKSTRPGEDARRIAEFTPRYLDFFSKMAIRSHINIVGGSQFVIEDDELFNVAFLFRRDGSIEKQYKIHITPAEWRWWGVKGGDKVEVFDTDCGRVAIQICYDIEFPELARIATRKGAQIIFVPFNTDERSGYLRVRHCAQARCIENGVYVVIAGCTGNLPFVASADVHYAQTMILTPSDIAFARDGIAAEATPNTETILFRDLDIEALRRHRYHGTTLNWLDRRKDLYELRYREKDEERSV